MYKLIDPLKCPICNEPNHCAQEIARANGKPLLYCWCMTASFSSELLEQVPEEAINKACICSKCASPTTF